MRWIVRAPTFAECENLRERVTACFKYVSFLPPSFLYTPRSGRRASPSVTLATTSLLIVDCFFIIRAAGQATSCQVKVKSGEAYHDVRQSTVLGTFFVFVTGAEKTRTLGAPALFSSVVSAASSSTRTHVHLLYIADEFCRVLEHKLDMVAEVSETSLPASSDFVSLPRLPTNPFTDTSGRHRA